MNDPTDDTATVYDAETGETSIRPLTAEELVERAEMQQKFLEANPE